jgi:hypothetical protein
MHGIARLFALMWSHTMADDWVLECSTQFTVPEKPPYLVTEYNGHEMKDLCVFGTGPHHVFAIGDWGGIIRMKGQLPITADKRSDLFPFFQRKMVFGVDDSAQLRVADVMEKFAGLHKPAYILNVGDNFYWAGVKGHCGGPPVETPSPAQFRDVYEKVYTGALEGIRWLGVLGNHDYGGYYMIPAWEKNVGYTWSQGPDGRWLTPALYWSQRVQYPESKFAVDYIFVDTNPTEAWWPTENQDHNICSKFHNPVDASCSPQGPASVRECHSWFLGLWFKQWEWLNNRLTVAAKRSSWQVIVTHFPAKWYTEAWDCLSDRYGIDLHVAGHIHHQRVYAGDDPLNFIKGGTCSIVTGGGGGITSEGIPSYSGNDDQYGFMDLEVTPDYIQVNAISHGGVVRRKVKCTKCWPNEGRPTCDPHKKNRRLTEQVSNTTTFI